MSNTNRMLSPDSIVPSPENPQSFNRYSYVENNPINFSDPTGHCKRPGDCLVVGGPDVSIGTWRWYQEVAPKNGVQMHQMSNDELALFMDSTVRDGFWEDYSGHNPYEAFAIGGSYAASASLGYVGEVSASVGLELVVNANTNEATLFFVPGWNVSGGFDHSALTDTARRRLKGGRAISSIYLSGIQNIEESNLEFSGDFVANGFTAADGMGVTASRARVPGDDALAEAYSENLGMAFGMGLSIDHSQTHYFPIFNYDWGSDNFDFTLFDYVKSINE